MSDENKIETLNVILKCLDNSNDSELARLRDMAVTVLNVVKQQTPAATEEPVQQTPAATEEPVQQTPAATEEPVQQKTTYAVRGPDGKFIAKNGAKKEVKSKTESVKRVKAAPQTVDAFITWFFSAPESELRNVGCGGYKCLKGDETRAHTLTFSSVVQRGTFEAGCHIIGIRPVGDSRGIFNASRIRYGTRRWLDQQRPQRIAEEAGAIPIPLGPIMTSKDKGGAGLDISKLRIVDWTGAEKLVIPRVGSSEVTTLVNRHFAGAAVINVENEYFLFDTDRNELKYGKFNPFLTKLPTPASSVKEAYETLMPDPVKQAILAGKNVVRQGEYFFVPADCTDRPAPHPLTRDYANADANFAWIMRNVVDIAAYAYNEELAKLAAQATAELEINRNKLSSEVISRFEDIITKAEHEIDIDNRRGATAFGKCISDTGKDKLRAAIDEYVRVKKNRAYAWFTLTGLDPSSFIAATINSMLVPRISTKTASWLDDARRDGVIDYSMYSELSGPYIHYDGIYQMNAKLSANKSDTNSHTVTFVCNDKEHNQVLAIGCVKHIRREHMPLWLDTWHYVYPNTSTMNLTVSGNVD